MLASLAVRCCRAKEQPFQLETSEAGLNGRIRCARTDESRGASANGKPRNLPITLPFVPMEARSVDEIPRGRQWVYEPKWDGFRPLWRVTATPIELQSKSGQSLTRYFPELVEAVKALPADRFILDGEIVVPVGSRLSFDQLLLRIHPAESRIRKLAAEHPSMLIVFDLLVDRGGESLIDRSLGERRKRLESLAKSAFRGSDRVRISPFHRSITGNRCGGLILPARTWMASSPNVWTCRTPPANARPCKKSSDIRTADCVVGGFRYGTNDKIVGSLLLGLYDDEGLLNHVGFTSNLSKDVRQAPHSRLEALVAAPGFTGLCAGRAQ